MYGIAKPLKINGVPINKDKNYVPSYYSDHSIPADRMYCAATPIEFVHSYTTGNNTYSANTRYTYPFIVANPTGTIKAMSVRTTGGTTNTNLRLTIYKDGGNNYPSQKIVEAVFLLNSTPASITVPVNSFRFKQGLYWASFVIDGGDYVLSTTRESAPVMGFDPTIPTSDAIILLGYTAPFTYGESPSVYPTGDSMFNRSNSSINANLPIILFWLASQEPYTEQSDLPFSVNGLRFDKDITIPLQGLYKRKGDPTCIQHFGGFGLISNQAISSTATIFYNPIVLCTPLKVVAISINVVVTTATSPSYFRVGLYKKTKAEEGILLWDSGDIDGGVVAVNTISCNLNLDIGQYFICHQRNSGANSITVRALESQAATMDIVAGGSFGLVIPYGPLSQKITLKRSNNIGSQANPLELHFTTQL